MSSDRTGKEDNSGAASGSRQRSSARANESEYLAQQAAEARAAMAQTLDEMNEQLKQLVSIRGWTSQYPWISVGAAAAAGFLAASAVTPARDETFKARLQSLFPEEESAPPPAVDLRVDKRKQKEGSALGKLAAPLMDAVKTALVSTITSAVTAKTHAEAAKESQDGNGRRMQEPAPDPASEI